MWRVFYCCSVLVLEATKILEYRPGINYGQVFRDYSNNGWHAVSGLTSSVDASDVMPTDRGCSIDGLNSELITLPSNDICSSSFSLPSSFMICFWILIIGDQDGLIFARYKANDKSNYYFYMRRTKTDDLITFKYIKNQIIIADMVGPKTSFIKDKWAFIATIISTTSINLYQNGILQKSFTIPEIYKETGAYNMQIGGLFSTVIGSKFILWSFSIDTNIDQFQYMSNTATKNCIVTPCDTCLPEIIFGTSQGCLSKEKNEIKNSDSKDCTDKSTGCIGSKLIALTCTCPFNSCNFDGNSHICDCPPSTTASSSTCSCSGGLTIRWDVCCEVYCLTCSRTSPSTCLACLDPNASPDPAGGCKCNDGYYGNKPLNTTSSCKKCHSECKTCSGPLLCETCIDQNALPHATTGCICKDKYYSLTTLHLNGNCKVCHSNCKTCVANLVCESCIDSNAKVHQTVGCICNDGYSNITSLNTDGQCKSCHSHCSKCSDFSHCTSCKADNAIPSALSGCECKPKYYAVGDLSNQNACLACYNECATCTENPKCKSCVAKFAYLDSNSNCQCNSGYFIFGTVLNDENSCYVCDDDCSSCDRAFICKTCKASNSKPSLTKGCVCEDKYYQSSLMNNTGACSSCHSHCATCQQANVCLTCLDPNANPAGVGCVCDTKFYQSGDLTNSNSCMPCLDECKTCENDVSCLTCKDTNSELIEGRCKCKSTFWSSLSDPNSCKPCVGACKTCLDDSYCLTCKASNSYVNNGQCKCNTGYYDINGDLTTEKSCFSCNSECFTCSEANLCKDCLSPYSSPSITEGCECIKGYYKNSSTSDYCQLCNENCETCSNSTSCDTCLNNLKIPSTENFCKCKDGYYPNKTNHEKCTKCPDFCITCPNFTICEICKLKNSNPLPLGKCECPELSIQVKSECICPFGMTIGISLGKFKCVNCHSTCVNCSDPSEFGCLVCKQGISKNLTDNTCSVCKPGYFFSENSCYLCETQCKTCSSKNLCHSCKMSDFQVEESSGLCKKVCPEKQFNDKNECKPCPKLCTSCNSTKSCKGCVENAEKVEGSCFCSEGFKASGGSCVKKYFKASLTINKDNDLKLKFSEKTENRLNKNDFQLIIKGVDFEYTLITKTNEIYNFMVNYKETIYDDTKANLIILNKNLRSQEKSFLNIFTFEKKLNKKRRISSAIQQMKEMTKAGKAALIASSIAIAIVSNPASAWAMLNTIQLITYLPLNSNPLTEVIIEFCGALGGFSFIPNPMPLIFSEKASDPPYEQALNYGISTSVFWINIGPTVTVFLAMLVIWPFVWVLSKFSFGKITVKLLKILTNYKYSVFLRFWTQAYLDLGFFAIIQMKSPVNELGEGYFNTASAAICLILFFATPAGFLVFSFLSYEKMQDSENESFHQAYGSLYEEFSNDKGFFSTQYYFVYFLRRVVYMISQVYLNRFLFLQNSLNLLFSVIQTIYLIYYKPFKEKHILIANYIGEACVLIVFSLAFVFLTGPSVDEIERCENIFIFSILLCMALQFFITIYCLILALKEMVVKALEKRRITQNRENRIVSRRIPKPAK